MIATFRQEVRYHAYILHTSYMPYILSFYCVFVGSDHDAHELSNANVVERNANECHTVGRALSR